eukprot:TRINITY_DN2581_c0_g1_i5.p2 TRINITY_DN2581_c0_g1~~TRINITY_DN2581_c0_g1_i5.p2  ORF type:complete len:194 (-),score=-17.63 TRINITY_DN2581_c0_g1_i5:99-680(-)
MLAILLSKQHQINHNKFSFIHIPIARSSTKLRIVPKANLVQINQLLTISFNLQNFVRNRCQVWYLNVSCIGDMCNMCLYTNKSTTQPDTKLRSCQQSCQTYTKHINIFIQALILKVVLRAHRNVITSRLQAKIIIIAQQQQGSQQYTLCYHSSVLTYRLIVNCKRGAHYCERQLTASITLILHHTLLTEVNPL